MNLLEAFKSSITFNNTPPPITNSTISYEEGFTPLLGTVGLQRLKSLVDKILENWSEADKAHFNNELLIFTRLLLQQRVTNFGVFTEKDSHLSTAVFTPFNHSHGDFKARLVSLPWTEEKDKLRQNLGDLFLSFGTPQSISQDVTDTLGGTHPHARDQQLWNRYKIGGEKLAKIAGTEEERFIASSGLFCERTPGLVWAKTEWLPIPDQANEYVTAISYTLYIPGYDLIKSKTLPLCLSNINPQSENFTICSFYIYDFFNSANRTQLIQTKQTEMEEILGVDGFATLNDELGKFDLLLQRQQWLLVVALGDLKSAVRTELIDLAIHFSLIQRVSALGTPPEGLAKLFLERLEDPDWHAPLEWLVEGCAAMKNLKMENYFAPLLDALKEKKPAARILEYMKMQNVNGDKPNTKESLAYLVNRLPLLAQLEKWGVSAAPADPISKTLTVKSNVSCALDWILEGHKVVEQKAGSNQILIKYIEIITNFLNRKESDAAENLSFRMVQLILEIITLSRLPRKVHGIIYSQLIDQADWREWEALVDCCIVTKNLFKTFEAEKKWIPYSGERLQPWQTPLVAFATRRSSLNVHVDTTGGEDFLYLSSLGEKSNPAE